MSPPANPKGQPINQPPPARGIFAGLSALDSGAKVLLGLGAFAATVAAGAWLLSSVVTAGELQAELAPRDAAAAKTDEDVELIWQTQVVLGEKVSALKERAEWQNEALWRLIRDLGLDRGRDPVHPPPDDPRVAQPAASATPTPAGPP